MFGPVTQRVIPDQLVVTRENALRDLIKQQLLGKSNNFLFVPMVTADYQRCFILSCLRSSSSILSACKGKLVIISLLPSGIQDVVNGTYIYKKNKQIRKKRKKRSDGREKGLEENDKIGTETEKRTKKELIIKN